MPSKSALPSITLFALFALVAPLPAQAPPTALPPVTDALPMAVEALIKAPPAEVWKLFSTPEGFKVLGVAQCSMDFRIGGLIGASYDPKAGLDGPGTIWNRILAIEPERLLAFRIERPPQGFPFMRSWQSVWSVVTLAGAAGGGTSLRLTQFGYGDDPEAQRMREFFRTGNAWTLKKVQHHFDPSVEPLPAAEAHR